MYLLDYLFVAFHSGLVLFNLIGWAWRPTRLLHLATMGATLLSWFGLGMFYGWGYCFCTAWHWQIKRQLGETDLPYSYIKYYADRLTGMDWDPFVVDTATLCFAIAAFALSCWLNWKRLAFSRQRCRRIALDELA